MKKVICIILNTVIILNMFILMPLIAQAGPLVIYEEDFESGVFTILDGVNGDNNTKQLLKDGQVQWNFERSGGRDFTSFPVDLVRENVPETNGSPNSSMVMNTIPFTLSDNTLVWNNLVDSAANAYQTGIVTVDFRIKRPASSSTVRFMAYEEPISGYANLSDNTLYHVQFNVTSNTTVRSYYASEYNDSDTTVPGVWNSYGSGTTTKSWWYFRFIINLDDQTVQIKYSTSTQEALTDWDTFNFMANGSSGSYTMANSLGAIAFRGDGYLAIDDVKVTYDGPVDPEPTEIVSDLSLLDQNGEAISSSEPISFSSVTGIGATANLNRLESLEQDVVARLIIAAYDEDGRLLAVKLGNDFTATEANPTKTMTIGSPLDISGIVSEVKTIKIFAWDFDPQVPYNMLVQKVQ